MANKHRVVILLAPLLAAVVASCAIENMGGGPPSHRGRGNAGSTYSRGGGPGEAQHSHQDLGHFDLCSEAEVGGILSAMNKASINVASAIMSKTTDPEVRAFAERTIHEHRGLEEIWNNTLAHAQVTPKESGISRDIEAESRTDIEKILSGDPGPELEEQLARKAVAGRLMTLSLINHFLLPSTDDEELRESLKVARATLAAQLIYAVSLERKAGGACVGEETPPRAPALPE